MQQMWRNIGLEQKLYYRIIALTLTLLAIATLQTVYIFSSMHINLTIVVVFGATSLTGLGLLIVTWVRYLNQGADAELQEREQLKIANLEQKLEQDPEKARFAWDLARIKLEAYFDRNLNQVRNIFYVAAFTMAVGFILILFGIVASIADPSRTNIALIASASGIITQFIRACSH